MPVLAPLVLLFLGVEGLDAGVDELDAGVVETVETAEAPAPTPAESYAPAELPPLDDSDLTALLAEPVVAAASRTAETTQDAPATTWSISGTDLKRYGIQSVEEAIRYLGHGMTSHEYDGRQSVAFGARGYNSDQLGLHVAVLIDGNQAGGSAKTGRGSQQWLLPIELVDHIDIVIGPGSVMYGNSAMLGIINVVMRSASSLDGTHLLVQGSAGTPGDTWAKDLSWGEVWGKAAAYGGTLSTLGGERLDVTWHLQARWDRQQGRRMVHRIGDRDPFVFPETEFPAENVFNRDFGARLFARATWGKWRALAWAAVTTGTGTGPIDAGGGSSYFEPEYGLDVTWASQVGSRGDLSLRVYGVVFDSRANLAQWRPTVAKCQAAVGTDDCYDTLSYLNFKPYIEPIFSWDWLNDGSNVSTVGAQLFIDGSVITQGVVSSDGTAKKSDPPIVAPLPTAAVYGQHVWRASFGTFNLGLRYDLGFIGQAISPRLAFTRPAWRNGTVKIIFSTGFRQPTITERFLEIPDFVTVNPNIQPERVYSGEVVLGHRFSQQSLQLSMYAAYWEGLINGANVAPPGKFLTQFQNLRNVWSAGVNLGWRGEAGPFDWSVSLNYAPGRVRLPGDAAQWTDQQLNEAQIQREAIRRYGTSALNSVFLPADSMPDFYGIAHVSYSLGTGLPRLSLAANVNSPRMRSYYLRDDVLFDPRLVGGPEYPWTADVRLAISGVVADRVGLSLYGTFRTLGTNAESPRAGAGQGPLPNGTIGPLSNPQAPVSVMAEVNIRL
ncbi:MAG: TonB-dependent receptor [Myxococcaceae bacterium]|nr:TonB-dependent receptor [Myxococcaceae bacterium]